jgi:hypothetical protein
MALSMQSATLAGKQITSAKVSSKRYVDDRALEPLGELRFSFFFSALLFFFVPLYFVLFVFGADECLSANKPLRRALTNRSLFSFRHSSVNKTVQASNLSEKLSKAAVTAATTAALFASVRPLFFSFFFVFKGWFLVKNAPVFNFFFCLERDKTVVFYPKSSVVFRLAQNAQTTRGRLSAPGATTRCDRLLSLRPRASVGAKVSSRASSSRVQAFQEEEEGDEDTRVVGGG